MTRRRLRHALLLRRPAPPYGVALPLVLAAAAAALWPVPVFQVLHAESSAVVAAVAFFAAGALALGAFQRGERLAPTLGRSLAALAAPLAVLTVSLLWAPNRGYVLGLALFATMTVPAVVLAVSVAWLLDGMRRLRRKRLAFWATGLAVALGGAVYDLGFHPQFYTYSHVFGGVLGPVYDEALNVRPGFFAFRAVTLGWAMLALLAGRFVRGTRTAARPAGLVMLALAAAYVFSGRLGFTTGYADLARALGGHIQTPHFDLFFDRALPPDAVERLAVEHEYRFSWLAARLGSAPAARIQSYLYPSAAAKGRLTGAATTSVAPVWLSRPQTHVAAEHFDRVFGHELVHAFSRDFGLPVVHASRHVGLVEGLAVAFEPPDGLPTPAEQVSGAMTARRDTLLGQRLAATLGAGGFWTGRGAVSYTTTGAFVDWLARTYGAAAVRRVYARGDFEQVLGEDVGTLGARWQGWLRDSLGVVNAGAGPLAVARFSEPSLFERPSPHYVPPHMRRTREAARLAAGGDTLAAQSRLTGVLGTAPAYVPALDLWARLALVRGGDARAVARRLARHPALAVRYADALAASGDSARARALYDSVRARVPPYDHDSAALLWLRRALAARPDAARAVFRAPLSPDRTPVETPNRASLPRPDVERRPDVSPPRSGDAAALALAATLARRDARPGPEAWPAPTGTPGLARRLDATRTAWAADAAWQASRYADAARLADAASRGYIRLGDRGAAAFWADRAALARFAVAHAPGLLARPERP